MPTRQYTRTDLTGQRFGRWVVLRLLEYRHRHAYWQCMCDCGETRAVCGTDLLLRRSRSCGCYAAEQIAQRSYKHGQARTQLYRRWKKMKDRCLNPANRSYPAYGGRGITICDHWRNDFEAFACDMGQPTPGASLERLDNMGPYSPENCCWATRIQQANNTRSNRQLTHEGRTQTHILWERERGFPKGTIRKRLLHGWTAEDALLRPLKTYKTQGEHAK